LSHTTNATGTAALKKFTNRQRTVQENAFGGRKPDLGWPLGLPRAWVRLHSCEGAPAPRGCARQTKGGWQTL